MITDTATRLVRYQLGDERGYGLLWEGDVHRLESTLEDGLRAGPRVAALDEVELLAPCQPTKIVAVGQNYAAHAAELGSTVPAEPLLFLKPPSSVIGPGTAIVYPQHLSQQVDYEAELAVVIGRDAWRVRRTEAEAYILGYTCANDVTARDLQRRDGQWTRSKGFDTFCPLGPWIVAGLDASDLGIRCRVNGELRQDGRTGDMVFGVPELIARISAVMTLLPGDVILTGTPSGIGPLEPGDRVAVEIEGVGILENHVTV
ncbi:MAG: fumarylacetoacetate hydrolase family protein [Anaerolineae bacterium]|nr:fumarylacetoacetate hydrolase family protein [Anaerolineae bacterium]